MIPAPDGIACWFEYEHLNGKPGLDLLRVVAFDDDGEPMVIADDRLRRASRVGTGKWALADCGSVTVIPGGGWMVRRVESDGRSVWSVPVVAWRIVGDAGVPMVTDEDGMVVELPSGDEWSVFHPDES